MDEILFNKVMCRINDERARLKAIRRFVISSVVCVGALVSSVFVWNAFADELAISGFSQYASLAFLDLNAVLINWQDFGMSLLESFPVMNAVELLGVIAIIIASMKFILTYAERIAQVQYHH